MNAYAPFVFAQRSCQGHHTAQTAWCCGLWLSCQRLREPSPLRNYRASTPPVKLMRANSSSLINSSIFTTRLTPGTRLTT